MENCTGSLLKGAVVRYDAVVDVPAVLVEVEVEVTDVGASRLRLSTEKGCFDMWIPSE